MIAVSIIVPVYNVSTYLSRCIDSILIQSYSNWELILVDDGSSDGSDLICDEYAKKDTRIRVFRKINGGVSSARNLGLAKAIGEWITFVDADDRIEKEYLLEQINRMNSPNVVMTIVGQNGMTKNNESNVIIETVSEHLKKVLEQDNVRYEVWGRMYKTEFLKKIKFNTNLRIGEDFIFNLQYLMEAKGMVVSILSPLYCYTEARDGSAMRQVSEIDRQKQSEVFDSIIRPNTVYYTWAVLGAMKLAWFNVHNNYRRLKRPTYNQRHIRDNINVIKGDLSILKYYTLKVYSLNVVAGFLVWLQYMVLSRILKI